MIYIYRSKRRTILFEAEKTVNSRGFHFAVLVGSAFELVPEEYFATYDVLGVRVEGVAAKERFNWRPVDIQYLPCSNCEIVTTACTEYELYQSLCGI